MIATAVDSMSKTFLALDKELLAKMPLQLFLRCVKTAHSCFD